MPLTAPFGVVGGLMYINRINMINEMTYNKTFEESKLIAKAINGNLSEDEQTKFNHWLNRSEENRSVYARFSSPDFLHKHTANASQIDWEQEYNKFMKRKARARRQRQITKTLRYAAMILLIVLSGFQVSTMLTDNDEQQITENVASIVSGKAILMLEDGQEVVLSDSLSSCYEQDGAQLTVSGSKLSYNTEKSAKSKEVIYNTLIIPRTGEFFVTLTDGTQVWLNSESTLRYPVTFSGEKRQVYLEGEAFLKVAPNSKMPFVVISGQSEIEVLGTEFNLRSYNNEPNIFVTLIEGSVNMKSSTSHETMLLKPGEQGTVVKINGAISKQEVDPYQYIAWKDGRLAFESAHVEEIISQLARLYDLQIVYADSSVKQISFTCDIRRNATIDSVIKIIESTGLIKLTLNGDVLTIASNN